MRIGSLRRREQSTIFSPFSSSNSFNRFWRVNGWIPYVHSSWHSPFEVQHNIFARAIFWNMYRHRNKEKKKRREKTNFRIHFATIRKQDNFLANNWEKTRQSEFELFAYTYETTSEKFRTKNESSTNSNISEIYIAKAPNKSVRTEWCAHCH